MKEMYIIFNNKTYESWKAESFSTACDIARNSAMKTGGTVDVDPTLWPVEREKVRYYPDRHYEIRK